VRHRKADLFVTAPKVAAMLIACLALTAGCGSESPSAPKPTETHAPKSYTDEQLVTALPRSVTQFHGVKPRSACRDLAKPCASTEEKGWGFADATDDPQTVELSVQIWRAWKPSRWKDFVNSCPDGKYEKPLVKREEIAKGAYSPGERGTARRTAWAVAGWTGFVCEKDVVFLWPEGKHSERTHVEFAFLNNGHHMLKTDGRTLAEVKLVATEYLDRLAGVTD
jgi:hypothetical protein